MIPPTRIPDNVRKEERAKHQQSLLSADCSRHVTPALCAPSLCFPITVNTHVTLDQVNLIRIFLSEVSRVTNRKISKQQGDILTSREDCDPDKKDPCQCM